LGEARPRLERTRINEVDIELQHGPGCVRGARRGSSSGTAGRPGWPGRSNRATARPKSFGLGYQCTQSLPQRVSGH
jgi:hypothetical protein